MPLVTVVMPAYQAARTIVRAIESIQKQAFSDWNLIVVDDASTDGTGALARKIASLDARIVVLANAQNFGAASSMNRAWRNTDAPLIAIMDADDFSLPTRLRIEAEHLLESPRVDVVGAAAHFIDGAGCFWRTVRMPQTHEVLERRRWYACPFVHPTVMMRRRFLEEQNGYTDGLRLGEDYDLWMRGFYAQRYRYENLTEPLLLYTAKRVQRWSMIKASARARLRAGSREKRVWRGRYAAARILAEGAIEQTHVFSLRDRLWGADYAQEKPAVLETQA